MTIWPASIEYPNAADKVLDTGRARMFDLFKTVMDYLLAVAVGIVLLPVLLICVIMIKLSSPGPILFRQTRLGKDGKTFVMLKLRTMELDAEEQSGPILASENDSRVIRSCRWMRRSHLDEIPQLINVLRGEMSLVGPRPERPEISEQVCKRLPEFRYRLKVRPGITGLAQICNGYDTCLDAFKHKLRYDLEYISRRNCMTELAILLVTLVKFYDPSAR
ncbi:MAG: sugar transferase [Planctomycetes bacterium]|nr:sugar transferase [Planctomycetota bacterium]